MKRSTAGGNQTSYQILLEWVQPKATPFVGWFNGDGLAQAIAAALTAARECGCKLEVKTVSILARKRQKGGA
jgi:hypothetical protein